MAGSLRKCHSEIVTIWRPTGDTAPAGRIAYDKLKLTVTVMMNRSGRPLSSNGSYSH
jgi:hypothetical protein